jgi:hypothetical protein
MVQRNSREVIVKHRDQLLKTLSDQDAGKLDHLDGQERGQFVASVKKRVADLSDKIPRFIWRCRMRLGWFGPECQCGLPGMDALRGAHGRGTLDATADHRGQTPHARPP